MRRSRGPFAMALALLMVLAVMVGTPALAKKPSKISVSFGSKSFVTGQRYAVRGKVSGPVKRVVKLQYQTKSGWRNLDSTRTKRKGKYKLKGRWDWVGTHRVRVYAPPTKSHRARTSKVRKFRVDPGYAPRGSRKNFRPLMQRKRTYRFDPCKAVRVRVNTDGYDERYLPTIQEALVRVSAATGLKMRYVGKTSIRPFQTRKFKNKANLIIDFGTQADEPRFDGVRAAAVGGPTFAVDARQGRGRVWNTKYAGVLVDINTVGTFDPGFSSPNRPTVGSLFMHEIGHALGLSHARPDDSTGSGDQIMSPNGQSVGADGLFSAQYGAGDLNGLRTRGLDQGCIKPSRKFKRARTTLAGPVRETSNGFVLE